MSDLPDPTQFELILSALIQNLNNAGSDKEIVHICIEALLNTISQA